MTSHLPDSNGDPLKIAVLSDVHGNLPAFRAVLEDIDSADVDAVWCLGDLVGYGAQPDECVELAAERCPVCLAGNHDLGVLDKIPISDFSPEAATAALWTRRHAAGETLEFLRSLEPARPGEAVGLFHASPRDPVWEYVLSTSQADDCLDEMEQRVGLIGHSHVALRFTRSGGRVDGEVVAGGTELELSEGEWLVNPGSVGQPRDGDPRAAFAIYDSDGPSLILHRLAYSVRRYAAVHCSVSSSIHAARGSPSRG